MSQFSLTYSLTLTFDSHPVGSNRYGETFLQLLQTATKVDEAELKALALSFAEQSREGVRNGAIHRFTVLTQCALLGPVMEPEHHAQNIAARVLAGRLPDQDEYVS